MRKHPVYLWTLPMFHCNGWCFPWSLSVVGGTHVTLRAVRAKAIWQSLAEHKVTHLCGAPIVMATILNAPEDEKKPLPQVVEFFTAAAPPPEVVLARMADAGFNVTHVYGLTETYGPAVVNDWDESWDALDPAARAAKKARQGVNYLPLEELDVHGSRNHDAGAGRRRDPGRGHVPRQHRDEGLSQEPRRRAKRPSTAAGSIPATSPCCTRTAIIQLKDRSKDIIISGGENISSIEVEDVLYKHPAVQAAAVVAKPDEKWGETPCAFVELKPGQSATADEMIDWCREGLARYKVPRHVVFAELPKTSTGKIQKFKLREMAKGV